jgi:hypothetical protein
MPTKNVPVTVESTGRTYNVPVTYPEGATDEEIKEAARKYAASGGLRDYENTVNPPLTTRPPPANYGERTMREYAETDFRQPFEEFGSEVTQRTKRYQTATQELTGAEDPETRKLRMGGAGRLMEAAIPVSQAARAAGETVVSAVKPLIPLSVRNLFGVGFDTLMENEVTQKGIQFLVNSEKDFYKWATNNPREAEALQNAVRETMGTQFDIGAAFVPRPDLINLDKQLAASNRAKVAANQARTTKRQQATANMIEPITFKTTDKTEKSMGYEHWVPDEFGNAQVEALESVPEFNPYGSYHEAMRVTQRHVDSQKNKLDLVINKNNVPIEMDFVNSKLAERLQDFKQSDVYMSMPKEARKYWDNAIATAQQIFSTESADLVGVLNARRRFDKSRADLGISQDAELASAQAKANRAVRGALNDILKAATEGVEVHSLLDDQFRILTAMDNLNYRRNGEARGAVSRVLDAISNHTGGLGRISTSIIGLAATGATIMQPMVGGAIAALGTAGYAGIQVQRYGKAAVLKAYGEALGLLNKSIRSISDPTKVEALELDRLVLIDMMNEAREYEEPSEDEKQQQ